MAATSQADGSEDVTDFLRRIKELGDKRDQEDAERTRKLEEDIAEARRQRAARRADRERSLSPEKSSPSGPPIGQRARRGLSRSDSSTPVLSRSTKPSLVPDVQADRKNEDAAETAKPESYMSPGVDFNARPPQPPKPVPSSFTVPSRSGTLSWQQRPASVRGAHSRPTSMLDRASSLQASELPTDAGADPDLTLSRDVISRNLGAKDPSWFRQTSDKGIGSPALRKSSDIHESSSEVYGNRQALHGLSRDGTPRAATPGTEPETENSASPSFASPASRTLMSHPQSSKMTVDPMEHTLPKEISPQSSKLSFGFPPPSNPRKDPGHETVKTFGSSNRPTFERPASPTKGMGGFVQSAMLKRSDSVNKRWSAQPAPRLSRQNSNAQERAADPGLPSPTSMPKLGDNNGRASIESEPQPGSIDSKGFVSRQDSITRGSVRQHVRSESRTSFRDQSPSKVDDPQAPPSPSKRWSPVKSSWLESALSRPEGPSPSTKITSGQPSWMVELNKAKPQRGSRDLESSSNHGTSALQRPLVSKASVDLKFSSAQESVSPTRVILPSSLFRAGELSKSSHSAALSGSPALREKPVPVAKSELRPGLASTGDTAVTKTPALAGNHDSVLKAEPPVISVSDVEERPHKSKMSHYGTTPMKEASPVSSMSDISKEVSTPSTPGESSPSPLPKQLTVKTSTAGSPRSKPDTPPKKDFRSALKPRQAPSQQAKEDGLEFQNAFGKLKRTQTQNYKAPDELKDNILKGKSGLSLTDGPQKTVPRDELKEDLGKQKEAMKAKASQESPGGQPVRKESRSVTPEAIAKRRALGSNESSGNILSSPVKPKPKADVETVPTTVKISDVAEGTKGDPLEQIKKSVSNTFADRFNPALAGVLARGSAPRSPVSDTTTQSTSPTNSSMARNADSAKEDDGAGGLQHMTKARARGPKRRLPRTSNVPEVPQAGKTPSPSHTTIYGPSFSVKSRNVLPVATRAASPLVGSGALASPKPQTAEKLPDLARKVNSTSPSSNVNDDEAEQSSKTSTSLPILLPPRPSKPSGLRTSSAEIRESGPQLQGETALPTHSASREIMTPTTVDTKEFPKCQAEIPEQSEQMETKSRHMPQGSVDAPRMTVKSASAMLGQKEDKQPGSRAPITLPTRKDEDVTRELVDLSNTEINRVSYPPVGSTPTMRSSKPEASSKAPALPLSTKPSSTSLTNIKPRTANDTSAPTPRSPSKSITPRSPSSQASEAAKLFSEFFGERPVAPKGLEVDTEAILSSGKESTSKIKTLRNQISEITREGKTAALSSGQEHVLYSSRMYLCTHVFGDHTGARISEVYLWVGSHIADSAVEDAQSFAKKIANQNSGKLIIFRQGKETANFVQALGGIIITRNGSEQDISSPYMLCCRQHLGHIAFDEVHFAQSSLCSGFAYIVAAGPDKIYLWKGSGCNTEELSVASLISMDISPARREEVEGQESSQFLKVFADGKPIPRSADHWKHKPKQDNYCARLFHVEWIDRPVSSHKSGAAQALWGMVRRQSQPAPTSLRIQEITPFTQRDIESENIYVLDAFFEIYIIIGPLANRKLHAFASALVFAQEYGILAASADNRPFVPFSSVVVEGVPRDMKAVFRSWNDADVPTNNLMAGKPKGASKSLKVLPLSAAIAAVKGA